MKQVAPNIYVEDQWSVPPRCRGSNWGYVTTSAGVVMIDSPMVPRTALEWKDKMAEKGEVRYLINTHHHVDHVTGNFFFPGEVVSSQGVRELFTAPFARVGNPERMAEVLRIGKGTLGYIRLLVEGHDPQSLPLLDEHRYQLKAPSITFSDRLTLYAGEYTFELMLLPGHTQSHIGVYIPQAKVFFAGDNFCNGTQPSMTQSLPRQWVKSLKEIEAMDIDAVVPGHGEMCDRQEVRRFRLFIQQCIRLVSQAIQNGASKEEAAATISFERLYPPDQRGMAVHPGAGHQHLNVMRLYDMLSG